VNIGAVCVVGAGIAGINASLELAKQGFRVYLLERLSHIGGNMARLDKVFPTGDCALCILHPVMTEAIFHPNIKIYTNVDIKDISGGPGDFTVKIHLRPKYVNEEACIVCGECSKICPVKEIPTNNKNKIITRSAIYIPFQEAVPNSYVIDDKHCLYFKDQSCKLCEEICKEKAINFDEKEKEIGLRVGAIIIATGFEMYDPSSLPKYGYDQYENIITGYELEGLINPFMGIGKPIRPSDKKIPKRVAWIKCVGSRDIKTNKYCSSVCCMYLHKQISILNENYNIKAFVIGPYRNVNGKFYQEYMNKVAEKNEIIYLEYEVDSIIEIENKNLKITLTNGESIEVDLVVLQNAMVPSKGVDYFFKLLNLETKDGFFKSPDILTPVETGYPGIYFCGCCKNPKDISTTIIESEAAASKAASLLSSVKNSFRTEEEIIELKEIDKDLAPRIGLIICHCGINISNYIDIEELIDHFRSVKDIVYLEDVHHACSSEVQKRIPNIIKEYDLNRFIIASCSPRILGPLFMKVIRKSKLNPYLFEMVNIRDQCAWVHSNNKKAATEKAKSLISMSIAKARLLTPIKLSEIVVEPAILVIGSGPAGISATLDISKQGFYVYLIEESDKIGGELTKLNKIFPSFEDSDKKLEELIEKITHNPNVEIYTNSFVYDIKGHVGNFTVTISYKNDWTELTVGAIIVATGADEIIPRGRYGNWSILNEVITQSDLEYLIKNDLLPPLENKRLTMIQCAGSRKKIGFTYCSRICCSVAIKNALWLKENIPSLDISILYRDISLPQNYEEFEDIAKEKGIKFVHYADEMSPEIESIDGNLVVDYKSRENKKDMQIYSDFIVLSTSIVPKENEELIRILRVNRDKNRFLASAHENLRPLDSPTEGIFFCGCIGGPVSVEESIIQGSCVAMRVGTLLSGETVETFSIAAQIDEDKCIGCGYCTEVCTANVIVLEDKEMIVNERIEKDGRPDTIKVKKARIIEANCRACYKCVVQCPVHAIYAPYFTFPQIIEMIKKSIKH